MQVAALRVQRGVASTLVVREFQAAEGMMRKNNAFLEARGRLLLMAALAPGFALAAPTAQIQSVQVQPAAAPGPEAPTSKPSSVEGVTVNASRNRPAIGVPPDETAALAAEAAKSEAWRKYRQSMPPLTSDTNDQSKDFPGLKTYVPQ